MKTHIIPCLVVITFCAPLAEAQLDEIANENTNFVFSGDSSSLVVKTFSLSSGAAVNYQTFDCGTNPSGQSEDTVMYLLEATSDPAVYITRAFNDDFPGLGFCSRVSYTNTSGATKSYKLIIAAKSSSNGGAVLLQYFNPFLQLWFIVDSFTFQGARWADRGWGGSPGFCPEGVLVTDDIFMTKPLRPDPPSTFGAIDPQLWAIRKTPGSPSYFDHDSGIKRHALLDMDGLGVCTGTNCDILAGGVGQVNIWRQKACDADSDGIVNAIENVYGTDLDDPDTDSDGITDHEELYGINFFPLDNVFEHTINPLLGWESSSDILPYFDADPFTQDLFLLMDWMEDEEHTHEPYPTMGEILNEIFYEDSAFTGREIRVHAFHGQNIGHWLLAFDEDCTSGGGNPFLINFYEIKEDRVLSHRRLVYHYAIFAHNVVDEDDNDCSPPSQGTCTGLGELFGNDIAIINCEEPEHGVFRQLTALVHELGHNLFLSNDHNGNDDQNDENSCVHSSVMNHRYALNPPGWGNTTPLLRRFGYSVGTCEALNVDPVHGAEECLNTCVELKPSGLFCVPENESSPKNGCISTPHGVTCDCDEDEWSDLRLDFRNGFEADD